MDKSLKIRIIVIFLLVFLGVAIFTIAQRSQLKQDKYVEYTEILESDGNDVTDYEFNTGTINGDNLFDNNEDYLNNVPKEYRDILAQTIFIETKSSYDSFKFINYDLTTHDVLVECDDGYSKYNILYVYKGSYYNPEFK